MPLLLLLFVGIGAGLGPGRAAAQLDDASRIVEGDSVRLTLLGSLPVEATFRGWDSDVMLLAIDGFDESWPVSIFDARRLELLTDRTAREGFRHGAVLGAVTGLFVGAGAGLILYAAGAIGDPDDVPGQIVATSVSWASFGAIGGALIGGLYGGRRPGRGWIGLQVPVS